ncbi:MAG: hypothetical protein QOH59_2979 [Gemmatimonadales bacterium]|jgi:hypothetical protein|nr:hypothetical protein [Gemmatimonadales bacterium]
MKTIARTVVWFLPATLGLSLGAGCGSTEAPTLTDHAAVTYDLMVNGTPVTAPYAFIAGQTVRVRIRFFNAEQQDLDAVEGEHFGGLTFDPASLATVARVVGHNFQFDVTGGTPGTGTLQVGYGHDDLADEVTFDPEAATVLAP